MSEVSRGFAHGSACTTPLLERTVDMQQCQRVRACTFCSECFKGSLSVCAGCKVFTKAVDASSASSCTVQRFFSQDVRGSHRVLRKARRGKPKSRLGRTIARSYRETFGRVIAEMPTITRQSKRSVVNTGTCGMGDWVIVGS